MFWFVYWLLNIVCDLYFVSGITMPSVLALFPVIASKSPCIKSCPSRPLWVYPLSWWQRKRDGERVPRQNPLAFCFPSALSYPYNVAVSGNKDAVDSGCVIHSGLWGVTSREGAVKSVVRIHPLALKYAGACSRHRNITSGASPPVISNIWNSILFRISIFGF